MICKEDSSCLPAWDETRADACPVDYTLKLMDTARKVSCGEDIFCREGAWQIAEITKEITEGKSRSEDYELLTDILEQIQLGTACQMAQTAAETGLRLLKEHEEEWNRHIRRKRCTNLICRCSYTLYIDPQLCDGCGECLNLSPPKAIIGTSGMIHIIDNENPVSVQITEAACPKGFIKRAGVIKPKLPQEPVPAGSFTSNEGENSGRTRRRRRR